MNLRLLNGGVGAARYPSLVMFDLAANLNHPPRLVPAKCSSKEPTSRQDLQLIAHRTSARTLDLTPLGALTPQNQASRGRLGNQAGVFVGDFALDISESVPPANHFALGLQGRLPHGAEEIYL